MPPTLVQSVWGAQGATMYSGGTPQAFPSAVTAGNKIIVMGAHSYYGCPPGASDNLGNSYSSQLATEYDDPSSQFGCLEVFEADVVTGGSCTVTLAGPCGSANRKYFFTEWSGLASGTSLEAVVVGASTVALTSSGNLTTTSDGALLLGMFYGSGSGGPGYTFTPSSGVTDQLWDSNNNWIISEICGAAGSYAISSSYAAPNTAGYENVIYAAAYKVAAVAPPARLPQAQQRIMQAVNRASNY